MKISRDYRLPVILLVSVVLRLGLVDGGGQFFFGDESRQARGVALYQAACRADGAAIGAAFSRPEHIGFTVLGAGITGLQQLSAQFTRSHDWKKTEDIIATFPLGAGWLSLFSVLNIWLVHAIARRAGAQASEAAWAALLMACSNTSFYYARHFLPYDAALSCALGAILLGLKGRNSLATGALAGACYHLYNGYWYLLPVVFTLQAFAPGAGRSRVRRLAEAGTGAALTLAAPVLAGLAVSGGSYWHAMVAFSGTVKQGLYSEGWSLPGEYLWHSEGILGPAVLLGILAAVVGARRAGCPLDRTVKLGLAALAMSYGWLLIFSVFLGKFVVYGRTVKPFVPFLCLAGGWAFARALSGRPRLAGGVAFACCAVAAVHFAPHFGRPFPQGVTAQVLREFGNPKHSLSVAGSLYAPPPLTVQRPELVLVNAQSLYPVRGYLGYPAGTVLLNLEHPLSYAPFQYEGHTPRERAVLRANDIQMRLIKLADPSSVPDDLPPDLRFHPGDDPDGRHD